MAEETRPELTTRMVRIDPKTLRQAEVNARFMRHETIQRLVDNLRADGELTSAPFAVRDEDGGYTVLSGNHRVIAAIEAEIGDIWVQVCDEPLSPDRRTAIQLSHNAIVGEDDEAILSRMYDSIEDIDMRLYSGLNDEMLEILNKMNDVPSIGMPKLEYRTFSLFFLPDSLDEILPFLDQLQKQLEGFTDVAIARNSQYNDFLNNMRIVGKAHNVINISETMRVFCLFIQHHATTLQSGWIDEHEALLHDNGIPLVTILGNDDVPAVAAQTIKRATDKMVSEGLVRDHERWQVFEILANEYLHKDDPPEAEQAND